MDALALSRWQFGITTVYHFLFVPITIGLGFIVAGFQTAWVRTDDQRYLKLTRFYGELFLINFALGVVTGIVQEFQFGMNWSAYSRFVGDIFGAPLAMEGLLAFFLESTFLGLWIFGWGRLPKRIHLATIWVAAVGTLLSALFILAANSWMQHPVGYAVNATAGRAELKDFVAVLTNSTVLFMFPHTISAAFLTTGAFVAGIALWRLAFRPGADEQAFRTAAKVGAVTVLVSGIFVAITGDAQARITTQQQPMKMAAAEALYETKQPASFSLFTIGPLDGHDEVFSIRVPHLLSFLATANPNGKVEGVNDLQAQYVAEYGPGSYTPYIPLTYWTFRWMIGVGVLAAGAAAWLLWMLRRPRFPVGPEAAAVGIVLPFLPLLANSFGWIFTEMGRQPWLVFGLMRTSAGVSPNANAAVVFTSMVGFTVLYGVLAVVEVGLLVRRIRAGIAEEPPPSTGPAAPDRPLPFAY